MLQSIAMELNSVNKGITVTKKSGLKLVEYSSGANAESYYQIKKLGSNEVVDYFYENPKGQHRKAINHFFEYLANRG